MTPTTDTITSTAVLLTWLEDWHAEARSDLDNETADKIDLALKLLRDVPPTATPVPF